MPGHVTHVCLSEKRLFLISLIKFGNDVTNQLCFVSGTLWSKFQFHSISEVSENRA